MNKNIEEAKKQAYDDHYEQTKNICLDGIRKASRFHFDGGFDAGVNHLKSLPLAERLTDKEIEKVKAFYAGETFGELDFIELISCRRILKSIFGKELFEE